MGSILHDEGCFVEHGQGAAQYWVKGKFVSTKKLGWDRS